ncbi:glycosyltransferase [Marinobacter salinexigens]|uniref:glycosyltransferase n=1 Tax=Marinobacter salinexigens TaxID=2919747 RepID=UPI00165FA172|nr:glycosyltransferase [Marinobacter salinexigens]
MSKEVGAELFEIVVPGNRVKRYFISSIKTLSILNKFGGRVVFFQNPSVILSIVMMLYKFISKKKFVMDCHNAGVFPFEGRSRIFNSVCLFLIKKMDLSIVTNKALFDYINKKGGTSIVLPDPLPMRFYQNLPCLPSSKLKVVFICTWAKDEPFDEAIKAFSNIDEPITYYITGRPPESYSNKVYPESIILTGFLSDDEYLNLIQSANLIIDLTLRDNCLVCGAYEAMAAGVPCIVSDFMVSRQVFKKGFVYSENDVSSITKSIKFSLKNLGNLSQEMVKYRIDHQNFIRNEIEKMELLL